MLSREEFLSARKRTLEMFQEASIRVTPEEEERIEVADFGLGDLEHIGLEILTYVNTDRVCAKELAMFPGQTCPEHMHPPVAGEPGKEETFRCRWGEVYLYVPGDKVKQAKAKSYPEHGKHLTVWHQVVLRPGEQYTLRPNTLHWFQGGPEGAIVSEFSTRSRDESDIFTDPRIEREPKVEGQ